MLEERRGSNSFRGEAKEQTNTQLIGNDEMNLFERCKTVGSHRAIDGASA